MTLPILFFWHGPRLGPINAAGLRSFLRHGHPAVLHCYAPPADVPSGVEIRDARAVMPEADLLRHGGRDGVVLAADRFAYRLLAAGFSPYCDADVFCLRPLTVPDYLFGWEDSRWINQAVLHAPADSELVRRLLAATEDRFFVPPWLPPRRRWRLAFRRRLGFGVPVEAQDWGVWGPRLLTWVVKDLGLEGEAAPIDLFYPLHWRHLPLLRDPGLRLADLVTPRTQAIELWNHLAAAEDPPPGSPLAEILGMTVGGT